MSACQPGRIILLGSGETSPSIRKTYDWLFKQVGAPVKVSILETPAGFEPNSAHVAGQVGDYLVKHLQNYRPNISIIPARKRGTDYSPDDQSLMEPAYDSDVLFMGPGSPTYTVRQLQESAAWYTMQLCHRLGADLILASAASLACSRYTIPVYEIYKVGEELHWKDGLNLFGPFGLNLIFVPHWNNTDGGEGLDTSRCYIGQARFHKLLNLLKKFEETSHFPTFVGIDENTALVVDPAKQTGQAMGQGGVTLLRDGKQDFFHSGESFPLSQFGAFQIPEKRDNIPLDIQQMVEEKVIAARERRGSSPQPSSEVLALLEERTRARNAKDWTKSDILRDEIVAAGWLVKDTREGSTLEPVNQSLIC